MKRTLLPLLLLLAASCQKEATTLPANTSTNISNARIVRDTIKFDQGYAGTLVQHNDDAILLSATFNDLKGKTLYIDKLVYRIHHTTDAHPKHLYIWIDDNVFFGDVALTDATARVVNNPPGRLASEGSAISPPKHNIKIRLTGTGLSGNWIRLDLIGADIYTSATATEAQPVKGLQVKGMTQTF